MDTLRKHILLIIILLLSACGGGGSEPKPVVTPPPVTTPDPTITLTKLSDADTNIETSVFKIEGSDTIGAFTFDLSNVATAYIKGNGQKTQITNNSVDVSGMSLKDFEISVMHDSGETMDFKVLSFTVGGKSYSYNGSAISVTFTKTEPVVNNNSRLTLFVDASVKISTEAPSQVVKGEKPSTLYLRNLIQKITKYNETLDSYEDYSEEEIALVDGTIDYHLPVGR
ncbi:hypothetical protein H4J42_18095, partial [Colwellia sp. BRX8-8]|nr:hypothetical protein [Colwellia sp. BRX8-8]